MILLLTGATGFVGRNLLLRALKDGRYRRILVPVRSREKLKAQFSGDGFDEIPSSVVPIVTAAPEWAMDFATLGTPDHVVHSAGVIFARERSEYFRTHVDGTLSLLRQLPGDPKVLILSSMAAAGPCPGDRSERNEEDVEAPVTWYGESKLEMERRVDAEFAAMRTLFLRPPLVLGARDQATLPLFKMVRGPVRFKPGLKRKYYSFIAVNDLVGAIFAALESDVDWRALPYRQFFVAAERPVTDGDLIESSSRVSGRQGVMLSVPQPLLRGVAQLVDRVPALRKRIPSLTRDRVREIWPDRWVVSPLAFEKLFRWKAVEDLTTVLGAARDWYVRTGQLRA